MRLLSLDYDPVYDTDEETIRAQFSSDVSVFDFDVVIWDPAGTLKTYLLVYGERYMGLPCLSDDTSVRLMRDVLRRNAEFVEFVDSGRTLIVIGRPPQECYIATGEKQHSGTGRNRETTRIVKPFDVMDAVPLTDFSFSAGSGTRIECVGSGPLVDLVKQYKARVKYSAAVTHPAASPFVRVAGMDRVVGAVYRSTNTLGQIVIMPSMDLTTALDSDEELPTEKTDDVDERSDSDDRDEGREEGAGGPDDDEYDDEYESNPWSKIAPAFQADLLSAIEALGGVKVVTRPSWTERFATDEQLENRARLAEFRTKVEEARDALAKVDTEREVIDARDQLFLGSGRALELEVRAVLELLGGEVTDAAPGRDDWRVAFPEGRAVVEVKGVAKSAAEKHAAQLEKWVAGAYEETGVMPKGILVVNTWRDVPLDLRVDADFPQQMIPYSTSRKHCLISGVQLFVLRAQIKSGQVEPDAARTMILETTGVLDGFTDWRDVIREVKLAAQ